MVDIKLLVIITDEGQDKKINLLLNRYGIKAKTITSASGTASPSLLDYFGLAETKKSLYLAIIPDYQKEKILSRLKSNFKLENEGKGIAFVVPISSANKFLAEIFSQSKTEGKKETMEAKNEKRYHLIITIVLDGYLETVVATTKKAGAIGGTVIKGRELSNVIRKKLLGFNLEAEREIVLNVVAEKDKKKVMEEISKAVGIKTPAKGICLAIPVEDAIGIER